MTIHQRRHLIPVSVAFKDDVQVTVTGESTTNPHLAVTPQVRLDEDGNGRLVSGLALTHIPSGRVVLTDSSTRGLDWDRVVEILTSHADWALDDPKLDDPKVVRQELFDAADTSQRWPWPEWAGDESTPAVSLLAKHLDDTLSVNPSAPEVREARTELLAGIADEVRLRVETLLRIQPIERASPNSRRSEMSESRHPGTAHLKVIGAAIKQREGRDVLAEARELLAGITPGPWEMDEHPLGYDMGRVGADEWLMTDASIGARADAEFIASSPDLVARLVAEVERLRMDLDGAAYRAGQQQ